jgi:pyruvate dehydrogenase E2 component (dihydrolipoamide acetyltransferase)
MAQMPMSPRRKLAIASWSSPSEGNIYGKLTVDATAALEYIEAVRAATGEKVTITHLVGRACAEALKEAPTLNGVIRFGSFVPHSSVDITYLVTLEGGNNLAKVKICNADQKSVAQIAMELREYALRLRAGKDDTFKKSQGPLALFPTWLLRPIVKFTGWLTAVMGINMPVFGLEAYPFGSLIITNVGVFGLDEGYAPPTPFAHVPVYVLLGAVREEPVVVDGAVVVRKVVTLCATIDHRFIDGAQGGLLAQVIRRVMADPASLDAPAQA